MHRLSQLALTWIANCAALYVASSFITGFWLSRDAATLGVVGALLTLLLLVVRPIVKLLFGPIILLTLGIGLILVDAAILFLLDILSSRLTIQGVVPLILASLLLGATNVIIHFAVKRE